MSEAITDPAQRIAYIRQMADLAGTSAPETSFQLAIENIRRDLSAVESSEVRDGARKIINQTVSGWLYALERDRSNAPAFLANGLDELATYLEANDKGPAHFQL